MKVQGQHIVAFIRHFAMTYDIPQITQHEGKSVGGIVLSTWSMSNNLTMSILANAESLPAETRDLLSKYLRSMVLLGH